MKKILVGLFAFALIFSSVNFASASLFEGNINRTLKEGMKGDDVSYLQNYLGITADGFYGQQTLNKVKNWQISHNLLSDGIFGPGSLNKLKTLSNTGSVLGVDTDTTPRIMYWYGKVNQHVDASGVWQSDPDGSSGANIDKLTYCIKWYPNTTSVEPYISETISTWKAGLNTISYTGTQTSYKCIQPTLNTGAVDGRWTEWANSGDCVGDYQKQTRSCYDPSNSGLQFTCSGPAIQNISCNLPVIKPFRTYSITQNSAIVGLEVTSLGSSVPTSPLLIYYGTTPHPTSSYVIHPNTLSVKTYEYKISNLTCGTKYYYYGSIGSAYSSDSVFTTSQCDGWVNPNIPVVSSPYVISIGSDRATFGGIISSSTSSVTGYGVCVKKGSESYGCVPGNNPKTGSFTIDRYNLIPGTAYTYKLYAETATETGYSSEATFTTLPTSVTVPGGWSDWADYGACVNGFKPQIRSCTNPAPANGGAQCVGSPSQSVSCSTIAGTGKLEVIDSLTSSGDVQIYIDNEPNKGDEIFNLALKEVGGSDVLLNSLKININFSKGNGSQRLESYFYDGIDVYLDSKVVGSVSFDKLSKIGPNYEGVINLSNAVIKKNSSANIKILLAGIARKQIEEDAVWYFDISNARFTDNTGFISSLAVNEGVNLVVKKSSTISSLTVLSPKGGDIYNLTDNIRPTWETKNIPATTAINVYIVDMANPSVEYSLGSGDNGFGTRINLTPSIMQAPSLGKKNFKVKMSAYGITSSYSDLFTINAPNVSYTNDMACGVPLTEKLESGMSGSQVNTLQKILNGLAYLNATSVDGKFGAATLTAVKAFQTKYGLTADGIVGAGTRSLLNTKWSEKCVGGNLTAPSITVLSPNGGGGYKVGEKMKISWNSKNVSNVRIFIYDEGAKPTGTVMNYIIEDNLPAKLDINTGYYVYDWIIPSLEKLPSAGNANYRIGIETVNNSSWYGWDIWDSSDNYFTITSPTSTFTNDMACGVPLTEKLESGMSGSQVNTLQKILNGLAYLNATSVDGKFGAATLTAVKAFQTKYGLTADGIVGAGTRSLLNTKWSEKCVGESVETPSVTILSPNGGEVFKAGDNITVIWNTSDINSNSVVAFSVSSIQDPSIGFSLHSENGEYVFPGKDGKTTVVLPSQYNYFDKFNTIDYGKYFKINAYITDKSVSPYKYFDDKSDNTFTITSDSTIIPNNPTVNTNICNADILVQKLSRGLSGNQVKSLQSILVSLGYLDDKDIDGKFGFGTRSAVIAFQSAKNLTPDGIVGAGTRAALNTQWQAKCSGSVSNLNLPDLTADDVDITPRNGKEKQRTISANIINNSSVSANDGDDDIFSGGFLNRIEIYSKPNGGGSMIDSYNYLLGNLIDNSEYRISKNFNLENGSYSTRVCADSNLIVKESNESNNCSNWENFGVGESISSIVVTSPNGGDTLRAGEVMKIRWNSANLSMSDKVRISVIFNHTDNTYNSNEIIDDWITEEPVYNTGYYDWVIPGFYATGMKDSYFKIKISKDDVVDYSDSYFRIIQEKTRNDFSVSGPKSGYVYSSDDFVNLSWDKKGDSSYMVSLLKNNDPSFSIFSLNLTEPSLDSYQWKIPNNFSEGEYYFKVNQGPLRSYVGYSDKFIIKN